MNQIVWCQANIDQAWAAMADRLPDLERRIAFVMRDLASEPDAQLVLTALLLVAAEVRQRRMVGVEGETEGGMSDGEGE